MLSLYFKIIFLALNQSVILSHLHFNQRVNITVSNCFQIHYETNTTVLFDSEAMRCLL